jgi:hypothetical protein
MTMPAEQHEDQHDYKIVVNGREKTVLTDELTFEGVLHLAFNPVPSGPNWVFTVTYRHAAGPRTHGTLVKGDTVKIKDGTVFHATATDKS